MIITESFLVIPDASLVVPLVGRVVVGAFFLAEALGFAFAIGEAAMDSCLTTALFISFLPTVWRRAQASVDIGRSAP
jgi:hypothetical protein